MSLLWVLTLLGCSELDSSALAQTAEEPAADAAPEASVDAAPEASVDADPALSRPFTELTDAQLERLLVDSPEQIGALSLGSIYAGALVFPVQMPEGEQWSLVKSHQSWGTEETVEYITAAIAEVNRRYPDTQPLHVGDISLKRGGWFHPHHTHQSGRDVDLGFYYKEPTRWYRRAWRGNLDVPRTWALLRALVTKSDVELIYVDRYVISEVKAHARSIGEDEDWLRQIFQEPSATDDQPLIRHIGGHRTHIHVRFYNPEAQRRGQRLHPLLAKHDMIRPPVVFTDHRSKGGETLHSVAKRYHTTRAGIRLFNELVDDRLVPRQIYKVPHEGVVESPEEPIVIPPRILPPQPAEQDDAGASGSGAQADAQPSSSSDRTDSVAN